MLLSFLRSRREALHIYLTIRPFNFSSEAAENGSSSLPLSLNPFSKDKTGWSSGLVVKSTDKPRHPAACLPFLERRGGGGSGLIFCILFPAFRRPCTALSKRDSYRDRAAGGTGVGLRRGDDLTLGPSCALSRVLTLVRDVVVALLRIEDRSDVDAEMETTDAREEEGLERG